MVLLHSMGNSHFSEDQSIEYRQDVLAVGEHTFQHAVVHGISLGQALPALEYMRGDVDVFAQLLQGVTSQEEAVEKGCFVLRFGKIEIRSIHTLSNPVQNCTQKKARCASKILCVSSGAEA
jgi:hypothetical protein